MFFFYNKRTKCIRERDAQARNSRGSGNRVSYVTAIYLHVVQNVVGALVAGVNNEKESPAALVGYHKISAGIFT